MQGNSVSETHWGAVAKRFNRQYRGEAFDLPTEVEGMPIFRDWASGKLAARLSSPFWELAKPKKNQRCLDVGCGVSFLVYPWRDWQALFYGQEISAVATEQLNTRGPQLNSKLFKGVRLAPAHQLEYEAQQFDLVIATGFSCYYPLEYWQSVLAAVRSVLKPDGFLVFDVLDPEQPDAENWAILETYLGAEVFLQPLAAWQQLIQQSQAKLVKQQPGELFHLYKIRW
ncbi:class I SAM-dependent methyltransferase [Almyronema epifaneia]|uniref:Class I SAM-dependent methyltransferase n=1 Tax=Almyronema epifaneia S1 TaxID=2991925 RepID=A0ABW6I9T3_9CYAN